MLFFSQRNKNRDLGRDGRLGAAFVDTITGIEPRLYIHMNPKEDAKDCVGTASHMLSYTWGYTVDCISSSLSAWCQRHGYRPTRTYVSDSAPSSWLVQVWTCFMGINQHRVQDQIRQTSIYNK